VVRATGFLAARVFDQKQGQVVITLLGSVVALLALALGVAVLACVVIAGRADRRMSQCWQEWLDKNAKAAINQARDV
jgi:hypothetical protein